MSGSGRPDALVRDVAKASVAEGIGDTPLRPEERPTDRTDPSAGDASTITDGVSPAAEPRPWIAIGVVLLVVFVAILAWAAVQPLL